MPDDPISADALESRGWRRGDGAAWVFKLGPLLEVRVTDSVVGWRPVVVRAGLRETHHLMFGMGELHRLVEQARRIGPAE